MFSTIVLLSVFVAVSNALNSTVVMPAGRTCVMSGYGKPPVCTMEPRFHELVKQLTKQFKTVFRPQMKIPLTTTGDVCSSLAPYIPTEYCSCADNSGGAVVSCKYNVVIDGTQIDIIYMTLSFEVCANPATIGVSMTDGDTGLTFSASLSAGESGSIPTGIMIGVPEFGEVQLLLTYKLNGNIDALTVDLGFDFEIVVFGFTEKCSTYFPSECPVWFFDETINFGNYC